MPATRSQMRINAQATRVSLISSRNPSKSSALSNTKSSKSKASSSSSKALDVLGGISKLLKKGKRVFGHGGPGAKQEQSISTPSRSSNISDVDTSSVYSPGASSSGEYINTRIGSDGGEDVPTDATTNTTNYTKNSSFTSAADADEVDMVVLADAAVRTAGTGSIPVAERAQRDTPDASVYPKVESRAIIPLPKRRPHRNWPMIVGDSSGNLEEDARPHGSVGSANPTRGSRRTAHAVEDKDVPVSSRSRSTRGAMYSDNGLRAKYNINTKKKSTKGRTTTSTTEDRPASSTSANGPTIRSIDSLSEVHTPLKKIKDESLTLGEPRLFHEESLLFLSELSSRSPSPYSPPSSSNRVLSSTRFASRSRRSKSPSPESPYARLELSTYYPVSGASSKDKVEKDTHRVPRRARTPFPHCPKSSSLRESLAPSPEIFSGPTRTATGQEALDGFESSWSATYNLPPIWPVKRRWPARGLHGKRDLWTAAGSEESFELSETEEREERKRGKKRARDEDEVQEESGEETTIKMEGPRRGKRTRYAAAPGPSSTSPPSPHTPNAQLPSPHSSPSPINRSPTPPTLPSGMRRTPFDANGNAIPGPWTAFYIPTTPPISRKEEFILRNPHLCNSGVLDIEEIWND